MLKAIARPLVPALVLALASLAAVADIEDLVVEERERPFLGVVLERHHGDGIAVSRVLEGSAAQAAGVEAGDVIVRIGDGPIHGHGALSDAIEARETGDSLSFTVVRDREERELTARLGSRQTFRVQLDGSYMVKSPNLKCHVSGNFTFNDPEELKQTYICEGEACRFSVERIWYRMDCLGHGCTRYRVHFNARPMLGV